MAKTRLVRQGSKYNDEQRRQAAAEYLVYGNYEKVGKITGIPPATIRTWRHSSEWWDDLIREMRDEYEDEILARNGELIKEAQKGAIDRVVNGDYKVVRGEIKRVPMTGKDLSVVSAITQDKRRTQLNMPTSITSSNTGQMDKFISLIGEMQTRLKEKRINSIHGEADDVTDQQRVKGKPQQD